jgi:hypothetical protein
VARKKSFQQAVAASFPITLQWHIWIINLKITSNYKTSKDGTLVPTLCRMVIPTCWPNMPSHSGRLDSIQVDAADKIIDVNQTQLKLPSKTGENTPYAMSEHKGPPLANLINSRRVIYKVIQIWPGQTVTCLHTNSPGHIWTTLYITKNITHDIPYLKKDLWNKARQTQQCNGYLSYNPVYFCSFLPSGWLPGVLCNCTRRPGQIVVPTRWFKFKNKTPGNHPEGRKLQK